MRYMLVLLNTSAKSPSRLGVCENFFRRAFRIADSAAVNVYLQADENKKLIPFVTHL